MLQVLVWLLPPCSMKNRLLRLFGHDIAPTARLGPTVVLGVRRFELGEHAEFGMFNVFRRLSLVKLDHGAAVESWNWISAHPDFQSLDPRAGTLFVATYARVGCRCYVDCSGTVVIHPYGSIGGNRCLVQTHQPDFVNSRQTAGVVTVGHHSMVSSGAVVLKGAVLPDKSLLAANSTLTAAKGIGRPGLYAGSPAEWKRETTGEWFVRTEATMTELVVEGDLGVPDDDRAAPNS